MNSKIVIPPPHDDWQSALEDVEDFREATPWQHYEGFVQVCRLASAILDRHPDQAAIYDTQDPLPESSRRIIERLRRD